MSYDYLRWKGEIYQTTDTPSQFMDMFEISEDGYLFFQECDHVWNNETTQETPFGKLEKVSQRWVHLKEYNGNIRFFSRSKDYLAIIKQGQIQQIIDVSVE